MAEQEYSSSVHFTDPPSASSIENTYRMAQVLYRKGDLDLAIDKYLLVCDSLERVITVNPGANIEVQWVVMSLGDIADIYYSKQDYKKALAYRNCQKSFLEFMQTQRNGGIPDPDSDSDDGSNLDKFVEVTSRGQTYRRLFSEIQEARELPARPPVETAEELLKKFQAAKEQDEEAKIDKIIKLLEEAAEQREKELKNSFWKRNLQRIVDHPALFVMLMVVLAVSVILFVKFRPRKRVAIPGGIDAQIAFLEKYIKDYEKKHPEKAKKKLEEARNRRLPTENLFGADL